MEYKQPAFTPITPDCRALLVVAEMKSISRAAGHLGIQQGALSKTMQRLEHHVGGQLLYRHREGVRLTPLGESLVSSLRQTEQSWQRQWGTGTGSDADTARRKIPLHLGCHQSIACNNLPTILPRLIEKHPEIDLQVKLLPSLEVTRRIHSWELDMGLVINPITHADLVCRTLSSETIGVWSHRKETKGLPLPPKSPEGPTPLLYNPEMFQVARFLRKLKAPQVMAIPDYEVIAHLVRSSQWLGILPSTVGERYGLHQVSKPLQGVRLSLVYRKESAQLPAVRAARDVILNALGA